MISNLEVVWYCCWRTSLIRITKYYLNTLLTTTYLITSHKVAILLDDVVFNDGWIIPSTFLQQTFKQFEVIRGAVLSEVSTEWLVQISRAG